MACPSRTRLDIQSYGEIGPAPWHVGKLQHTAHYVRKLQDTQLLISSTKLNCMSLKTSCALVADIGCASRHIVSLHGTCFIPQPLSRSQHKLQSHLRPPD
eukprot:2047540-Amphidinium_carterae.1